MIKIKKRSRKYFEPHVKSSEKTCDHEGCNKIGEYKSPKDRTLEEYYYFCLGHAAEYNAKWNYYEGISAEDREEEFAEYNSFNFRKFKSKVNYTFGADFDFNDFYNNDFSVIYSVEELKFFKIMEIDSKEEINIDLIKKQYKELAKKYHPDLNQGNKEYEERFKEINTAYSYLQNKFS